MPRFFVSKDDIENSTVRISGDDARHISRSLRMAEGDAVTVSDNSGVEYTATLIKIRDEECLCEIISENPSQSESPVDITLFMAYPKGDKLEMIIQKATELGVRKIVPFESSRCIKRPREDKIDRQTARLSRIAEEACKQCGRSRLVEVSSPISFEEMLREAISSDVSLFCYEGERERSLKDILSSNAGYKKISVIVGSEGGFSEEEALRALRAGCLPISLGKRILRCETAPLFVLSAISYELEL